MESEQEIAPKKPGPRGKVGRENGKGERERDDKGRDEEAVRHLHGARSLRSKSDPVPRERERERESDESDDDDEDEDTSVVSQCLFCYYSLLIHYHY